MNRRTFYFNTGVKAGIPANERHISDALPVHLHTGQVWRNGTIQIPFECDDVPDNAIFLYACASSEPATANTIVRPILNSSLASPYAHFRVHNHEAV